MLAVIEQNRLCLGVVDQNVTDGMEDTARKVRHYQDQKTKILVAQGTKKDIWGNITWDRVFDDVNEAFNFWEQARALAKKSTNLDTVGR